MIYSMTAFAREQTQTSFGHLVCEIRSINHRFLEINLHLPEVLRAFEMSIREAIRKSLSRGKVECSLRLSLSQNKSLLTINDGLAKELCRASEKIAKYLKQPAAIQPAEILRFPGVVETKESNLTELKQKVAEIVSLTLKDLSAARGREGQELKKLFIEKLKLIQKQLDIVKERLPLVLKESRKKLKKRFEESDIVVDSSRLEQELVFFAQKIDVAEEIDRIITHSGEIKRVLKTGGVLGRRFDFLLQELNREANTLGSKSIDTVITHAAVEIKVLLEQIREQVQNIE